MEIIEGNVTVEKYVDTDNIEYKLFINLKGNYAIRVRDLDADANVSIVVYPSKEKAEFEYKKVISKFY